MNVVAPSGVLTFVFTDIEGSTRRREADADAMRAALAVHDDLLRDIVDAHSGYLFKHTGDGVCAAFSSPRAAVDAAVAAQRDDTGHFSVMPSALAVLASILARLELYEPAAIISVPASTPFAEATYPEIHETVSRLRDVLGDDTYGQLARKGSSMSRAVLAAYALEQIDVAREELRAAEKTQNRPNSL